MIKEVTARHGHGMDPEGVEMLTRQLSDARSKFDDLDLDKNGVLNAAELHVSISPPQSLYLAFCLSSVMALTPRAFVWRHIESCDVGLDVVSTRR